MDPAYDDWIRMNEHIRNTDDFSDFDSREYAPRISVIMPVWNPDPRWLKLAIQSVMAQTYGNWELCVADGNSDLPEIRRILEWNRGNEKRIKVTLLPENRGISGNTNEALKLADGEFVCFLDHDDMLSNNCLSEAVKELKDNPSCDIIYSDNDIIDENGCRRSPFFKFDFSLAALLSTNYPFHLFLCRKSLVERVGGLRKEYDGAQDYDLILRLVECTSREKILHIAKILYHWRAVTTSSAHSPTAKPYAYQAGQRAIEDYLIRNRISGQVCELDPGSYRVKKSIVSKPKIIVAIMSENEKINRVFVDFLRRLLSIGTYPVEILFVPSIYSHSFSGFHVEVYRDMAPDLQELVRAYESSRIIFIDDKIASYTPPHLQKDWIDSLIEHFDYFPAGIVGTGSLTFTNIICNVQRTCGPVFCTDSELFISFYDGKYRISDYDDLQIKVSDFAARQGFDNLYTPFSIGNVLNYSRISDYYTGITGKFFTRNMHFYLPDHLKLINNRGG